MKYLKKFDFIAEKMMIIDDDVDLLYNLYYKKDIDETNYSNFIKSTMFKESETDTSILKNELCIKANKINPCKIIINHYTDTDNYYTNHYNPSDKIISISVGRSAINYAKDNGGDLIKSLKELTSSIQRERFTKEFTISRIKGSISHELSHWLDDTFHNSHISKYITKNKDANLSHYSKNTSYLEIESQMQNIRQIHREYADIWDLMSFDDMLSHAPSLHIISQRLTYTERINWTNKLKKRMNRENLLGKDMR